MKITKKRIVNVEHYISTIRDEEEFYVAISDLENQRARSIQIGFTENLSIGEQILPLAVGPVTRFNANGKNIIRRDLEKETFYVQREWSWTDWADNTHSKVVFIPRLRFPRDFINPPSEELLIDDYNNAKIIVSRQLVKTPENFTDIKHIINVFLELFGECDLIRENYQPFIFENITRLNWRILPPGQYPWEKVREQVKDRIQQLPRGNRPIVEHQLEIISNHTPNFVAVGQGGFSDYMVFGFPVKNIYVLESTRTGNATYVFNEDWEVLSQMNKAEILNNNLQQERILHTPNWEAKINQLLR
jgi:hypothetical protein